MGEAFDTISSKKSAEFHKHHTATSLRDLPQGALHLPTGCTHTVITLLLCCSHQILSGRHLKRRALRSSPPHQGRRALQCTSSFGMLQTPLSSQLWPIGELSACQSPSGMRKPCPLGLWWVPFTAPTWHNFAFQPKKLCWTNADVLTCPLTWPTARLKSLHHTLSDVVQSATCESTTATTHSHHPLHVCPA